MGNVVKTLVFLVLLWFLLLFVLPIGISIVEVEAGLQRFPPQILLATSLLVIFTILGLWSAMTLALAGRGTPAAFAPPRKFVVSGPYAYLRHPFATALTGQAVGMGIALGSIPVLVYATALMTVYYFLIRPREERSLEAKFGEPVRQYSRAVRGFRPRLKPYRPREIG